jgi:hypothetical protein
MAQGEAQQTCLIVCGFVPIIPVFSGINQTNY